MSEQVKANDHSTKDILVADLKLVLVAFIWGAGIPMSAVLTRAITPLWAVACRMLLSSLFLLIIFRKKIFTASRRDWAISAMLALVLTCVFTSLTFGLYYSTASKQALIGGLNVIIVPLFVWAFYRKRPSNWVFAGAAITTAGLMIMGFTPGMEFNFGDFLSFIMAIFYALQVMASGYGAKRVDPGRLVALHIIVLAGIMTVLALIFEPMPSAALFTPKVMMTLLAVSLGNTILCFFIQFKALEVTPETHAAIILSLEALFGYLIAVVSGQDPFVLQGAFGGLLMIAGIIVTEAEGFVKKAQ
ncbi:DMT family transporter [Synergistaceae bacterium OttesenSCG-928-D05]|nr:DMT family transporter [Synergistaceae bacterium OttesenSCG-928-D05]